MASKLFSSVLGMSIEYQEYEGDIRAELVCPDDDVHGKYIIDGKNDLYRNCGHIAQYLICNDNLT